MSEVCASTYLAGLVSTHVYLTSWHLCQTPLNVGEAYPVHTWLTSCNCAIHTYMHTYNQIHKQALRHCIWHAAAGAIN